MNKSVDPITVFNPPRASQLHWPEYVAEALLLGLFMISASAFTILLEHPVSSLATTIPSPFLRRALIGVAMGITALCLIKSPLGRRSGAHLNPAVTLAFRSLGKVKALDACFYIFFQFLGAVAGVILVNAFAWEYLEHPSVNYVATVPGPAGVAVAFVAEFGISSTLMLTVLLVSNQPRLERFTPYCAAVLAALFISFEAPISGMSMNPARTFGSSAVGGIWTALWIYFAAPILAMQTAAILFQRAGRFAYCAKLDHQGGVRCIFNCAYGELVTRPRGLEIVPICERRADEANV